MPHALYTFRRCPYAMRARMALFAAEVAFEHREIELKHKPQSMLDASPKGTVPVLVLDNGKILDESLDIMKWALDESDPFGWLSPQKATQFEYVQKFESSFKPNLDRYKYATRFAHENNGEGVNALDHRSAATALLEKMDNRLSVHGTLFGAQVTFADIATFPFVRQFANVDRSYFDELPITYVHKWLTALLQSDLFNRCMKKVPVWTEA